MCGFFPPYSSILQCQQGVLQLSGDSLRPHRLRTQSHKAAPFSNATLKSRLLPVILTNCLSIRGSQRPLHGFYNMLQWFWTQEYSLLPICQLIINGYNSVTARLRDVRAGMGSELPRPLRAHHPHPCTSIYSSNPLNLWNLSTRVLYGGSITQAQLIKLLAIGGWTLSLATLALGGGVGRGLKGPTL